MSVSRRAAIGHGFTLVELAVVVAIIGIIAAVALPRILNQIDNAELSVAKDLLPKLVAAAATYTGEHQATPDGFDDFVTNDATLSGDYTLSLAAYGSNPGQCVITAATLTCTAAFNKLSVVEYYFQVDGVFTYDVQL